MTIVALFADRLVAVRQRFFPRDLFHSFGFSKAPQILRLESLEPSQIARQVEALGKSARTMDLFIPTHLLLKREIALPVAALRRADDAISVNMRQSLPAQGKGLIWRKKLLARTAAGATFAVFIAKHEHLDAVRDLFRSKGLPVRSIGAEVADLSPFYSEDETGKSAKVWRGLAVLCMVAGTLWAAGAPLMHARQLAAENAVLENDIDTMKDHLLAFRTASDERAKSGVKIGDAIARLNRDRHRPEMLASLTESLPDNVWVAELTITGSTIYIAAFTKSDVTGLLNLLASLPWVETARLDGPIIPDSVSGESRFQAVLIAKDPT